MELHELLESLNNDGIYCQEIKNDILIPEPQNLDGSWNKKRPRAMIFKVNDLIWCAGIASGQLNIVIKISDNLETINKSLRDFFILYEKHFDDFGDKFSVGRMFAYLLIKTGLVPEIISEEEIKITPLKEEFQELETFNLPVLEVDKYIDSTRELRIKFEDKWTIYAHKFDMFPSTQRYETLQGAINSILDFYQVKPCPRIRWQF